MSKPNAELCYPVLTPFKFRGDVIKPPAYVQMDAEDARPYQAAGVLGGEDVAALPPEPEPEPETDGEVETEAGAAAEAATLAAEASAKTQPPATATKAAAKKAAK